MLGLVGKDNIKIIIIVKDNCIKICEGIREVEDPVLQRK